MQRLCLPLSGFRNLTGLEIEAVSTDQNFITLRFQLIFFHEMADDKKNSNQNKRDINQKNDHQAIPDGHPVSVMVEQIDEWAQTQTNCGKDDTTNEFPFPANNQNGNQDKRRNKVHQEIADLLPDGEPRGKGIECEHAYKENGQDTNNPWQPMDKFEG